MWLKKLCQFITNQFFVVNIPAPSQVYHVGKNVTPRCLLSCSTNVTERCISLENHNCTEVHANKAKQNKSAVSYTYWRNKDSFT